MLSRIAAVLTATAGVVCLSCAASSEPPYGETTAAITGGTRITGCAWPSVAALSGPEGRCTGVLVNDQVLVYAAHCGDAFTEAIFGNDIATGMHVPLQRCRTFSSGGVGTPDDIAYCVLQQPFDGVPITPLAAGCEIGRITSGGTVTVVGFGKAADGPAGIKRAVTTTITQVGDVLTIGGDGKDSCAGDSGAPALLNVADAAAPPVWRVIGVVSSGATEECTGDGGQYTRTDRAIAWLEQSSRLDLTPCYDDGGNWAPTPDCGAFAASPDVDDPVSDSCDSRTEYSQTCGPPFSLDGRTDDKPPKVAFRTPVAGSTFPLGFHGQSVPIDLEIDASDAGLGVRDVRIAILDARGSVASAAPIGIPPYSIRDLVLPEGDWKLTATATDYANNAARAEIAISVGMTKSTHSGDAPGCSLRRSNRSDSPSSERWTCALCLGAVCVHRRRSRNSSSSSRRRRSSLKHRDFKTLGSEEYHAKIVI